MSSDGTRAGQREPLLRLSCYASGIASALAVNVTSGDYGWRSVAVALLVAGVAVVSWVLRRKVLPESRIGLLAPTVLLALALLAALAALVEAWTVPASLVAVGLVVTAILVPTEFEAVWRLLIGAAVVGGSVAEIGMGMALLRRENLALSVASVGEIPGGNTLLGAFVVCFGVLTPCIGVAIIRFPAGVRCIALDAGGAFAGERFFRPRDIVGVGWSILRDGVLSAGVLLGADALRRSGAIERAVLALTRWSQTPAAARHPGGRTG
ncbi:hypothetical protein ACFQFC_40050 [Amorphoplanes digitatis]|uniref:Uncharacterized protein n=1 Tax=Actinoplanes digitatis TaxID=1868 RepID=A0A7W7MPR4_9ACTN|nr:hypothetical protein [Actinoplanes digitatis]MBB4762368.1 hypothetical protein [Actinoplanes digitatis]GID92510.1 hypothetical protein Adi01nite_19220 [Actinoplanes digitatis]